MKRRMVLLSTAALAGCSKYGEQSAPQAAATSAPPASEPASAPATASATASPPPQGEVLVKAADVPVGGGTVITDKKVVVTQPKAGEFKAFSAVCTHQGCLVNSVSDGTINCPCHGSKFRITDASVAHGPAKKPLPPEEITEKDGEIFLV
ncbi:Rieske (2Fe-2S) protein [Actinacidiphila glaucinigra]|uniref:Rieske (2Fe-2S) protein n=1 Tax=Actinacidiphila glaucinigra TaxID=235986 RepID=UPI002DDA938C|nr:Rieske (2Fe-2S) protein [Actinacidiphila glaucinigra]WSD62910.1 Rieske (2Fe-2S) protein [Actinacidiphila glaucinigra]